MPTMIQIKQDVLRVLNKRDEALANLPIPMVTDSSAPGSSTTIKDTRLGHGTGQANRYDGRNIEIVERPGGASEADSGETAGIDDAGFNNTDTITFSPALTFVPDGGQNYLIYGLGLSKEALEEAVNEMLRQTFGPHVYFPSLVPDSDLTAADTIAGTLTTYWAEIAGSSLSTAPEYDTTAAGTFLGAGSVHGIADAAGEGWACNVLDVHEGETMFLSTFVRANVGSVIVSLYDVTAGADISPGPVTIDEPAWTEVRFNATIPADCEQVEVRFTSVASADDFYMSAHVILQASSGGTYTPPTWLTNESQILDWVYLPRGIQSEDANSYVALGQKLQREQEVQVLREELGVHPFRINLQPANDRPVAMIAQRAFTEITLGTLGDDSTDGTNETTTPIDREYARSRVTAALLRDFGDPGFKFWARAASVRAESMGYGLKGIQIEPTPTVAR